MCLGLEYLSFLWFQCRNHKNWSQKRGRYRYENVWYRKNSLGIKNKKETGSVKILIFSFHDGHLVGRETVVALIGGKVPWHHQSCVGEVHPLL